METPAPAAAPVATEVAAVAPPVAAAETVSVTTKNKRGRKSLRPTEEASRFVELPSDEVLQQKLYHSITEVCAMLEVNPSTLRYWETEFRQLQPRKNRKGDRFYTAADIKLLHLIYFLLRQRKYTIEGAKEYLKKYKDEATLRYELVQGLQTLKDFLLALKADL